MNRYHLLGAAMFAVLAMALGTPAGLAQTTPKAKGTTTAKKTAAPKAALLDINTATKAELTALPGRVPAEDHQRSAVCAEGPVGQQEHHPEGHLREDLKAAYESGVAECYGYVSGDDPLRSLVADLGLEIRRGVSADPLARPRIN